MGKIIQYEILRGENSCKDPGKAKDYSGTTFRNTFQVTGGDIYLTKLNLFGPCTAGSEPATSYYNVRVVVEPSLAIAKNKRIGRIGEVSATIKAKRHEQMTVKFDTPVKIMPNEYVDIAFYIREGDAKTGYLDVKKAKTEFSFETQDGPRKFYFFEGSGQMPWLEFQVLEAAPPTSTAVQSRMVGFEDTSFSVQQNLFDKNA